MAVSTRLSASGIRRCTTFKRSGQIGGGRFKQSCVLGGVDVRCFCMKGCAMATGSLMSRVVSVSFSAQRRVAMEATVPLRSDIIVIGMRVAMVIATTMRQGTTIKAHECAYDTFIVSRSVE
mmetsp:Transcript_2751/g.7664  ORF Transcript_2751/g.7664 Transcript_2751/m.7664 type:complete len:121 (-) Transcript_2751:144-506(-)